MAGLCIVVLSSTVQSCDLEFFESDGLTDWWAFGWLCGIVGKVLSNFWKTNFQHTANQSKILCLVH